MKEFLKVIGRLTEYGYEYSYNENLGQHNFIDGNDGEVISIDDILTENHNVDYDAVAEYTKRKFCFISFT